MPRLIDVGVSMSVKDSDVAGLSDALQDQFIAEVAENLTRQLRKMVLDTRPRSDFRFWVTGPHNDPLQGMIHVHHLVAKFDLDQLPTESDAYRTAMTGEAPSPKVIMPGPRPEG